MMGHDIHTPTMLNVENLREGRIWGEYHEIGHNSQHRYYTIEATGETGCNVWSYNVNSVVSINFLPSEKKTTQLLQQTTTNKTICRYLVLPPLQLKSRCDFDDKL